jgi:hypothetical protein
MWRRLACCTFACILALASAASAELIGWWTFDDPANLGADSSGKGNDGTVAGDAQFSPAAFAGAGALLLDGTDDYIQVGLGKDNMLANWTSNLSIAAWIKPDDLSRQWNCFFGHTTENNGVKFELMTGNFRFTTLAVQDYDLPVTLTAGEWVHVALTFSQGGTMAIFYADGQKIGQVAGSAPALTATGSYNVGYGGYWEPEQFQGLLDEVRIYDHVLTAAEVKQLAFRAKAYGPNPADGAVGISMPLLQWKPGSSAAFHNVYLGTSPELTDADLQPRGFGAMLYYGPGFTPGVKYYWRVDEVEGGGTVYTGDVWSFTAMPMSAYLPQPADGAANIVLTPTLSWSAGQMATGHHLYFGTDRSAVEAGAAEVDKGPLALEETSYKITAALEPDLVYFWRVDESKLGGSTTGEIWSFSTVWPGPTGAIRQWWLNMGSGTAVTDLTNSADYPDNPTGTEFVTLMEGPTDWADNYATRLYGWVYPPQSGDYTFWIASDDASELWLSTDEDPANATLIASVSGWMPSRDFDGTGGGDPGTAFRSNPIKLEAGQRYYIEALQKEGGGGDNVAVAWQGPGFTREVLGAGGVGPTPYLPQRAYSPLPADGAVDTLQSLTLTWNAGEKALQHELYLGDDANAVAAADTSSDLFKGRQSSTSYDTGELEWGKTFFWRVDEINEGEAESPWVGRVWSFSTANFIPVDDFESYNDVEGTYTRIYETWIDGYTDGLSGSVVGNFDPPFAEQTIVHGGLQSMPIDYNNIVSPYFSEAYREFSPLMNWTGNGVTDLSLWVRGNAARMVEDPAGTYAVSANSIDVWGTSDNFRFVYKTLTGDGAISAKVLSVTNTSGWAKAGVMIRDTLDPASSYVFMFPTPDGRRAFQNRPDTGMDAVSAHSDIGVVTLPFWVKVERKGMQFTGYYSLDGVTWTPQPDTENTGADRSPNPQTIAMGNTVCLGLAVASNNAQGGICTAVFSDVVVTGGASFKVADIGSVSPGNDTAPLYIRVEDSTGKKATVVDPNAAAVTTTKWTEWKIPLSDLAGVNLSKVKRLYIGVGDKENPVPDGYGRVYIDDIRVVKP